MEDSESRFSKLESFKDDGIDFQTNIEISQTKVEDRVDGLESMMLAMEDRLMTKIKDLEGKLRIYTTAMKNGVLGGSEAVATEPRIDVPKPDKYKGTRSAQEVENFIWGLEQYFEGIDIIKDSTKVTCAANYLIDDTLIW